MSFSEKTQRKIGKYIVRLVNRQPEWLRQMFEKEDVCFCYDDDGSVSLAISEAVEPRIRGNAQKLIAKYMRNNPCEAIVVHKVQ